MRQLDLKQWYAVESHCAKAREHFRRLNENKAVYI